MRDNLMVAENVRKTFDGKVELLMSLDGHISRQIPYGQVPAGQRVDVIFGGELTGGLINGCMEGIDYYLIRSDEVGQVNVRGTIYTNDGAVISLRISGYMIDWIIADAQVNLESSYESHKFLGEKIIIGKGHVSPERIFVD